MRRVILPIDSHFDKLFHLHLLDIVTSVVMHQQQLLVLHPLIQIKIRLSRWPLLVLLKVTLQLHESRHPYKDTLNVHHYGKHNLV